MELSRLALTVSEDPDHDGEYHWLLIQATGDADFMEEHSASEHSFPTAHEL